MTFADITIEPASTCYGGEFNAYGHDTYPRSSVLAGQPRRVWLSGGSLEELRAAYPNASVIEGTTRRYSEDASLEEISGLPENPPSWFDPLAAGEAW